MAVVWTKDGGRVDNWVSIKDLWPRGMADGGNRVRDKLTDFWLGSSNRVQGGETSRGASENKCSQPCYLPFSTVSITAHLSFTHPSWKTTADTPSALSGPAVFTLLTSFPSNRASLWKPGRHDKGKSTASVHTAPEFLYYNFFPVLLARLWAPRGEEICLTCIPIASMTLGT